MIDYKQYNTIFAKLQHFFSFLYIKYTIFIFFFFFLCKIANMSEKDSFAPFKAEKGCFLDLNMTFCDTFCVFVKNYPPKAT